ncbi:hypothetical protein AAY473_036062 [Plecturocebus cupreus]
MEVVLMEENFFQNLREHLCDTVESRSFAQAGRQVISAYRNLCLPGSRNSPASTSQVIQTELALCTEQRFQSRTHSRHRQWWTDVNPKPLGNPLEPSDVERVPCVLCHMKSGFVEAQLCPRQLLYLKGSPRTLAFSGTANSPDSGMARHQISPQPASPLEQLPALCLSQDAESRRCPFLVPIYPPVSCLTGEKVGTHHRHIRNLTTDRVDGTRYGSLLYTQVTAVCI